MTDEEIDLLVKRVEEKLRQKMIFQEIMTIREDMRRALDDMAAKLDRCIEICRQVPVRNDSDEDAA